MLKNHAYQQIKATILQLILKILENSHSILIHSVRPSVSLFVCPFIHLSPLKEKCGQKSRDYCQTANYHIARETLPPLPCAAPSLSFVSLVLMIQHRQASCRDSDTRKPFELRSYPDFTVIGSGQYLALETLS